MYNGSSFLHPHQHLLLSDYLILTILVGAKRYLVMVLICTFLKTYDMRKLACVYWPFLDLGGSLIYDLFFISIIYYSGLRLLFHLLPLM